MSEITAGEIWKTLSGVDVSKSIKKKGGLDYLPWAVAHSIMMKHYPEYVMSEPTEYSLDGGSVETAITITIGTVSHSQRLPVMDYKNQSLVNPDSRDINDARQRCYVKCLAWFGLGISLYGAETGASDNQGGTAADRYKAYGEALRTNWGHVIEFKEAAAAYLATSEEHHLQAAVEAYADAPDQARRVLQMAPTKGGCLEVKERQLIKTDEFSKRLQETIAAANNGEKK